MDPCQFYKLLAEPSRLTALLLLTQVTEACVCDLAEAMAMEQPKLSRHLALLREANLVATQRRGKWIYYQLHPQLPQWCRHVLATTQHGAPTYIATVLTRLQHAQQQSDRCCS